ncbi:P-loop containing nucleoside triphosphate hydrolase protein, partial [Rozella allomycis CSF55]
MKELDSSPTLLDFNAAPRSSFLKYSHKSNRLNVNVVPETPPKDNTTSSLQKSFSEKLMTGTIYGSDEEMEDCQSESGDVIFETPLKSTKPAARMDNFSSNDTTIIEETPQSFVKFSRKSLQSDTTFIPCSIPIDTQKDMSLFGVDTDVPSIKFKIDMAPRIPHIQSAVLQTPLSNLCLLMEGVMDHSRNLIVSAPTSSGKTLIGDILFIKKTTLLPGKKTLIVVPFVSMVQEKAKFLDLLLSPFHLKRTPFKCGYKFADRKYYGLKVVGFHSQTPYKSLYKIDKADVIIATIEKANGLINKWMDEDKLGQLGTVIVDELHLIGDESRGHLIESLLTKLLVQKVPDLQLIGMSATLPNLQSIANWMDNAQVIISQERPVPLTEYFVSQGIVYDKDFKKLRNLDLSNLDECGILCQEVAEN